MSPEEVAELVARARREGIEAARLAAIRKCAWLHRHFGSEVTAWNCSESIRALKID